MKRIILDHLKRWSLGWITIGILHYFISFGPLQGNSTHLITNFLDILVILWISAFALNLDLQNGSGRVQLTLPMSARQIGRAWWLLSVALPTLFLTLISSLAMVINSANGGKGFPLDALATTAITYALCFGSLFYLIFQPPGPPRYAISWVRTVLAVGFFFAIFFIKHPFDTPQGNVFLLATATMSVLGWLHAEIVARERGGFRMGVVTGTRNPGEHQSLTGFGGLPLLWQKLAVLLGFTGLAIATGLLIVELFFPELTPSPKELLNMLLLMTNSFGYILVMSIIPQLRHLRTLPISTAKLAGTLVFIAVTPGLSGGLAWAAVSGTCFQIPAGLVMSASVTAICVPTIVWRGLKWGINLLICLCMIESSLGPIFYHLLKIPPIVTTLVSLCFIALAYELTRRLLLSSSRAYR